MLGNFQKTFKPTEADKEARAAGYLNMLVYSVLNHSCMTCKHCKSVKDYEHGKETSVSYCSKLDKYEVIKEKCCLYEVANVSDL